MAPADVRVNANPDARGEDDPLYAARLTRDGWAVTQQWEWLRPTKWSEPSGTVTPEHRDRPHPAGKLTIRMKRSWPVERSLSASPYHESFEIRDAAGSLALDLAGVDWADWDRGGRLVFLRGGAVWAAEDRKSVV